MTIIIASLMYIVLFELNILSFLLHVVDWVLVDKIYYCDKILQNNFFFISSIEVSLKWTNISVKRQCIRIRFDRKNKPINSMFYFICICLLSIYFGIMKSDVELNVHQDLQDLLSWSYLKKSLYWQYLKNLHGATGVPFF